MPLATPDVMTRGLIMQKACCNPEGPQHLVGTRFQVCFTPLTGVLFAFPSRYLFAIGHRLVFSLGGWAPRIRTEFHVFRPTWDPARLRAAFGYGAFTLFGRLFQAVLLTAFLATSQSRNPGEQAPRFGLRRVRSPLLAPSLLFSFPAGTEMFHFPASRPPGLCIQPEVSGRCPRRIAPFGYPGINVCLPLHRAFRSLPRPSSPCGAKASTVRPFALDRVSKAFVSEPRTRFSSIYESVFSFFRCQRAKSPGRGNRFSFSGLAGREGSRQSRRGRRRPTAFESCEESGSCFLGGGGSKLPSAMCRRVWRADRLRPAAEQTN